MKVTDNDKDLVLFVLDLQRKKDWSAEVMGRHVAHLKSLDQAQKLVLTGPFLDHPSGIIILKVATKEEALEISKRGPLVKEGYLSCEVRTWKIGCEENNFLSE